MSDAVVSRLRARIEELSSAIKTQKQVGDLETRRTNARRDLNAILDPMTRLPLEISSEIFTLCLPDSPRPHSGEAPMLLLNICHLWSNIALSTPSLWSSIQCGCSDAAHAVDLETWLSRARGLPLCLSIYGDLSLDVAVVVKKNAPNIQMFQLQYKHLNQMVTLFPSLTKLEIFMPIGHEVPSLRKLVDVLRAAPALAECCLRCIYILRVESDVEPFTHSCLRLLRLGAREPCSAKILKCLTLPALETLIISHFDIYPEVFARFLARSLPPLKSLSIAELAEEDILDPCFRLIPSVTNLTLHFANWCPTGFAFAALRWMATVLPDLRSLRIHCNLSDEDINYDVVVGALASRRTFSDTPLRSFELFITGIDEPRKPNSSTIAAFRQLAVDGMHIHVGSKNDNYI
ncbi:hypothetical protein K438DRAFT_774861 [Mycena galopus ATCC 62051]|nr:hypothetical protein K438DRAFT_774861 [Mycena galopus ATCC 62051]